MRAEEIPEFFPENLEATNALLRKNGVKLAGFGTSAAFHNEERAKSGVEESKKAVDVCVTAGIPAIRVFGDQIPDKDNAAATVAKVLECIAEVCRYAEGKGVDVLLEVHGDFNTIETVGAVIEACKEHACFGILWDVEHSDRAYADNWEPFYQVIRPYVRHIHMKDHVRNADGTFTLCLPRRRRHPHGPHHQGPGKGRLRRLLLPGMGKEMAPGAPGPRRGPACIPEAHAELCEIMSAAV